MSFGKALFYIVTMVLLATGTRAEAKSYDEIVRGWEVTELESMVFYFDKPAKKQFAIFSAYPTDVTVEESNAYVKSARFAKDAKRIRERDLGAALDTDVNVVTDRRDFDGTSVGIIETRFQAEGRQILITEHLWVMNKLVFHFIVTTKNVMEQPSKVNGEVFDEFLADFRLQSRKTASLLDLFISRANAQESVAPRGGRPGAGVGRRAGESTRPQAQGNRSGALPPNCVDRAEILGVPRDQLRSGPPALIPTPSMAACGSGIRQAWNDMKASLNTELTALGEATAGYMGQQHCEEMNPYSARAIAERDRARADARRRGRWAQFTNAITSSFGQSGLADAYNTCVQGAGTRALVDRYLVPAARQIAATARDGVESFRRDPARSTMNAMVATNPALMVVRTAIWAGTGDNLAQAYNLVSREIHEFSCLKDELRTASFCSFVTKAVPGLVAAAGIAVATGGTGAVAGAAARAAQIGNALRRGLTAARGVITAATRRAAASAERRLASGAAAAVERRGAAGLASSGSRPGLSGATRPRAPETPTRAASRPGTQARPTAATETTTPGAQRAAAIERRNQRGLVSRDNRLPRNDQVVEGRRLADQELGRTITDRQAELLQQAHELPTSDLAGKARLLDQAGFTVGDRQLLMRRGVAGDLPPAFYRTEAADFRRRWSRELADLDNPELNASDYVVSRTNERAGDLAQMMVRGIEPEQIRTLEFFHDRTENVDMLRFASHGGPLPAEEAGNAMAQMVREVSRENRTDFVGSINNLIHSASRTDITEAARAANGNRMGRFLPDSIQAMVRELERDMPDGIEAGELRELRLNAEALISRRRAADAARPPLTGNGLRPTVVRDLRLNR